MAVQISGNDITVPRDGSFTRNVTIGGTLTYEDVTNIDSVGLVTARQGIEIGASPGVAASISVDGNMIVSGISTFGGALSGTTGTFTGAVAGTTGTFSGAVAGTTGTFSSEITGTRANVLASSTPQIRINNDTGDGSGTRVMLGKATTDNNFVNGAASGDTVLSVPGKFIHGVGTSAKVTVETAGNGNVASNLKVAGVCTATSFSGSGAALTGISAGITMMDQWRITGDNNKTDGQTIDTNWERSDTFFAQIGSGMSESSGIFTFPQTGIYLLMSQHAMNTSTSSAGVKIRVSSNSGSDYSTISYGEVTVDHSGYYYLSLHAIVDVTNASNFRLKLEAENSGNVQYSGDTDALRNGITFIRLGYT